MYKYVIEIVNQNTSKIDDAIECTTPANALIIRDAILRTYSNEMLVRVYKSPAPELISCYECGIRD